MVSQEPPPAHAAADGTAASDIAPSGKPFQTRELASCPPPEHWNDWTELDARAWPGRVERHYTIVPTVCFNCEAACGLLAYVDKETKRVQKFEGNPYHPGSRGRNCAKGPATINQINDPERILYPMKRVGPRGGGGWERTTILRRSVRRHGQIHVQGDVGCAAQRYPANLLRAARPWP